jgi:glycosyltransferase involved in cell wall biosynthesis
MKSILKGASAIHATCEEERESVEALGISTPVTIVTNGANLPPNDEFYPEKLPAVIQAMPQEQRLVLFMSRLDPVKGLDLLIESWGRINTAGKRGNAVLAIAGPDEREYGKVLKTMACEHGVEHSICFLGMIDGNAKWALYHRADFFVLPSYSENFGLVVGEALACQTPVITTTGTPWTELDAWNAGLCVAPEQKEVQSALMQLLAMPRETLRNMGTCGKRLVAEHYSWDAMADKLVETYRCILNGEEVPRWGHPSSCFPPTPDSLMHRQRQ